MEKPNIDCPFCKAGIKPRRSIRIPLRNPDGTNNGKLLEVKENSALHKQITEQTGKNIFA